MKTLKKISGIALLLAVAVNTQAVEGLRVSLQDTNAILSWTSTDSDFYLVQYSTNLNSNPPWQTLTNWMPGAEGTNTTHFIHEGAVPDKGATASPFSTGNELLSFRSLTSDTSSRFAQWVMPRDNPLSIVPMFIYPPGYNFNGFLLFDPFTESWSSGDGIIRSSDNAEPPIPSGGFETNTNAFFSSDVRLYRVVRHGVSLIGITNGMTLSGIVTIPLEVGLDDGVLTTICVEEDGTPIGNSIKTAPFSSPLQVTIDTTSMSNGVHEISAFASWSQSLDGGEGNDTESEPVTVNVFNPISFPDWMDYFGEWDNRLSISAQSAYQNIDWYVDVWDSCANYIGYLNGHSSDGNIHAMWNLIGPEPDYYAYTNEPFFDIRVEIVLSSKSGAMAQAENSANYLGPIKRTYRQTDNWTTRGMWVVANQRAWPDELNLLDGACDLFAVLAENHGLIVNPTSGRQSEQSFRIPCLNEPILGQINAWNILYDAIVNPVSRNLFYFGHGGPNRLGTNLVCGISADWVAEDLSTIPIGKSNRHAYRFVFLYGCETANGKWPEAFGIVHRENVDMMYYIDNALTPSTFVGWSKKTSATVANIPNIYHSYFLQWFIYYWNVEGYGVKEALTLAANHPNVRGYINKRKLKVFGNWDQRPTSFNR